MRLLLLSNAGTQARKSGRKGEGCSTGRGDWQKLTFKLLSERSQRFWIVIWEQFSWRKHTTLQLALYVVVIVP